MSEKKNQFPGFIGPSNTQRVSRFDCQRTVNMYLENDSLGAGKNQEPAVLIGTPGLSLFTSVGPGPIRCVYNVSNSQAIYIVSGNQVFVYPSPASNPVFLGVLTTFGGYVSCVDNGIDIVFVDGTINAFYSTLGQTNWVNISNGGVTNTTVAVGGSGYVDGVYPGVTLTGGTGQYASMDITVTGSGVVTATNGVSPGVGYTIGDVLTVNNSSLGGTGSGFSVTVTAVGQPNFYPATQVTYQDSYFLFVDPGTQNFFSSDSNKVSFSPLNYCIKAGNPDKIVGLISNNRELYVFGQWTTEIWWNAGTGFPPFQRQDGKFSQIGCLAPASISRIFNSIIWLGASPQGGAIVYMMENDQPQRISNHAVEFALQSLGTNLAFATAYSMQLEGHYFYFLNCTGLNTTWVYDLATEEWFEMQSSINGVYGRHLAQYHCYLNGIHYVGDYQSANIYTYDFTNYTDNGSPILRLRQAPHISEKLQRIFYHLLEIDFSPGTGVSPGLSPGLVNNTYATLDPIYTQSGMVLSNGNLTATRSSFAPWAEARATIGITNGSWYWEGTFPNDVGSSDQRIGITNSTFPSSINCIGIGPDSIAYVYNPGNLYYNSLPVSSVELEITNGTVMGFALNADAGTLSFYISGILQGTVNLLTLSTPFVGPYFPATSLYESGDSTTFNFGATPFVYPVPPGFNAGLYVTNTNPTNAIAPTVWLEVSNDGGMTFGSPIQATIGKRGNYYNRARWQRLGSSRDRVYRVTCTDPVQFDLLSAMMDVEVGSA